MKKIYLLSLLLIFSFDLFCQIYWEKHPDNPVMVPGISGEWDEAAIVPGSVIYYDNLYQMWYFSEGAGNRQRIGHATSPDGITWMKDTNNPVLDPGSDGEWDDRHVSECRVLVIDSVFHMWYDGRHTVGDTRTGHATSPDGITWTKDTNNPVLEKGDVGEWDDLYAHTAYVLYNGSEFHMWYNGWDGTDPVQIGHATSPDGVNWTKDPLNPVLTFEAEEWDNSNLNVSTVLFDGTNYHMWYDANRQMIGYATSEDGSAWTKCANNPVLTQGSTGSWDSYRVLSAAVIDSSGKYKMWFCGSQTSIEGSIGYAETYEPAWKLMTSLDIAKGTAASCVIDSMIYVFGGTDSQSATLNSSEVYNTVTDDWSDLAPVPMDLDYTNAGIINDKIYIAGGWQNTGADWITINSTYEFDPIEDSWETKKECPKKSGDNASCVLNDRLYLFGGLKDFPNSDTSGQKDALVYDPATDTWDSLPDMLYARGDGSTACLFDDKIYVFGGLTNISNTEYYFVGKPERYDPGENNWTELADMPVPVIGHINLIYKDKIYVFGGDSAFHSNSNISICTNIIQEYDPLSNQWQLMEPMPFNRTDMTGQKVGNYAFLIGGYPQNSRDFSSVLSDVWRFNLDSLKASIPVTGISLDMVSLELNLSDTARLVATVIPSDASYTSVSWSSGDSFIATVKDGTVTGFHLGETYIYVTTNVGNIKDSCLVTVTPDGINITEATGFKIFPNPASDLITIEFGSHGTHAVEITSLNGQLLYSDIIEGPTHQIGLSSYQKGLYFITIRSNEYVKTKKIIKQE